MPLQIRGLVCSWLYSRSWDEIKCIQSQTTFRCKRKRKTLQELSHMLKKDYEILHWQSRERWTHLCLNQNWRESIICLVFSFAFMIGDSLSQDRMCGRYLAYANIPRLCRACNVTPEESEDPSHVCNYLYMQKINQKCYEAMKFFSK